MLLALLTLTSPSLATPGGIVGTLANAPQWPTGDPRPEWWTLQVEVRHRKAEISPDALLQSLGVTDLGHAERGGEPEHLVTWHRFVGDTLRPLAPRAIQQMGVELTEAEGQALLDATVADVLVVKVERDSSGLSDIRAAHTLIGRYLEAVDGGVFDLMSRQAYSSEGWKRIRLEQGWSGDTPDVTRHVNLHAYIAEDGLGRLVTVGLVAFGLPEIEVDDCAPSAFDFLGATTNVVAGQLLADPVFTADRMLAVPLPDGRVLKTRAEIALPQPGDQVDWLISLQFREQPGETAMERQAAFIDAVAPTAERVEALSEDPRQTERGQEVRASIPKLRKRFAKLKPGQTLFVKAPFSQGAVREWMWVEILKWEGTKLEGPLESEASVLPLKRGTTVYVHPDDVVAWRIEAGGERVDALGLADGE